MTNQSLSTSTSREPPPPPRELRDYLASRRNAITMTPEGKSLISGQRMPIGEPRRALEGRRELLRRTSGGANPTQIAERVARLFARFPQSRPSPEQTQMTLAAYATDLSKFPLWAIDKAIGDMLATEARAFMPSALELRHAVELVAGPVRQELADLETVLAAEPIPETKASEEEQAQMRDKMQALIAELKQNADPRDDKRRPLTRDEAQAALERIDPSVPPPGFSPALRKLLVQQGHLAAEPVRVPEPEDRGYPDHD